MSLVYLNGEYKPLAEANINVLDRGFIFGDGVYEVVPVFNRTIFRFEEHIQRLENSLNAIYIRNPLSKDDWRSIFLKLIDTVEQNDQSIYLQITRGVSERDYDISFAEELTILAMARPLLKKDFSSGIKAITHIDIRWKYCDIKAITLLPGVLLRQRAKEKGAREAILIRAGQVTEGAASNVFICKNNKIITPPSDRNVLSGVTRNLLLEILEENDFDHVDQPVSVAALMNADEIWVTSSTWEIAPVIELDDKPVAAGKPGPVWNKINVLYQEFKGRYCSN